MPEELNNGTNSLTYSNTQQPGDKEQAEENNTYLAKTRLDRKTPWHTDKWIYRIVVSAMSVTIISSLGGAIWLQANDKETPEVLIALGTGALGGIAGLLAPTPPNYSNDE